MASYIKVWTSIRYEPWWKELKASGRGALIEMLLMVKEQRDNGHLVCSSASALAKELSINRRTLGRIVTILHNAGALIVVSCVKTPSVCPKNDTKWAKTPSVCPPTPVQSAQAPYQLYFPKYMKWQKMGVLEAVQSAQAPPSQIPDILEQTRPDQSKPDHSPAVKKPPKETNPDHKLVVEYFCQAYQDKIGAAYAFHGKEDGGKIKTLLSRFDLPQIKALIDTMFASDNEFYRKGGGYTIGVLLATDNTLVQELRRRVDGTNNQTKLGAKNAATMARVLKEMECQANPKISQK